MGIIAFFFHQSENASKEQNPLFGILSLLSSAMMQGSGGKSLGLQHALQTWGCVYDNGHQSVLL
jgi:hypothetical protein